jgi:hypothetical protein
MPIIEITNEIYDINGFVRSEILEIQVPEVEDQILEKEDELIKIYNEIQELKIRKSQIDENQI